MFCECKTLKYFPDLAKWNKEKVFDMSNMFSGCLNLRFLPDLTQWKI